MDGDYDGKSGDYGDEGKGDYDDDYDAKYDDQDGGGGGYGDDGMGGAGGMGASDEEEEDDEVLAMLDGMGEDMPAFASQANKDLNRAIRAKEAQVDVLKAECDENQERVQIMEEHLRNVSSEFLHTQQLVDAKGREVQSEDHLRQLATREAGRIRSEIGKLRLEYEDVQDKLNIAQNAIFKGNERMDRLKLQMTWSQEQLEQWALAARQKEEDNLALQKYTRADDVKVKELTLNIEKLTQQTSAKKVALDQEVTDTQAKQIELDKTAEEFRALHRERQQLVRQWQESIAAMQRRDEDIKAAAELFATAKESLRAKEAVLTENEERLAMQIQDNTDQQSKISARERLVAREREEAGGQGQKTQDFKDEVDVLKNELAKAASDLAMKRSGTTVLENALEEKEEQLELMRKHKVVVQQRLQDEKEGTVTVEQQAKRAETVLEEKLRGVKTVEKDLAALKEQMFKQSQILFQLRQEEANLIAEISGAQAAGKNLGSKVHRLDQNSLRQQELIYNAEFQIQQLERKVSRASGERSDEEKIALNAKIEELNKMLVDVRAQSAMLNTQVKKIGDELRTSKWKLTSCHKAQRQVFEEINELNLINDAAIQTLRAEGKEKEEVMVQHDVLKLEVKRLRDLMTLRADDVFGLQNRKFQLEMSMKERKKEIEVHRDVQRAQSKVSEEERHKVAMEGQGRKQKVQTLKAKYETVVGRGAMDDDGGDGSQSQAYFVIQAAQKREELQREGDELDLKIRKAEREIRALEKTLNKLNARNQDYRQSFHRADMGSKDALDLRQLTDQTKLANDALFKKRKELQRLRTDLDEDQRRFKQVHEQRRQLGAHLQHLEDALEQVDGELMEQREQVDLLNTRVQQLSIEHREDRGVAEDEETAEEKMFRAQVRGRAGRACGASGRGEGVCEEGVDRRTRKTWGGGLAG